MIDQTILLSIEKQLSQFIVNDSHLCSIIIFHIRKAPACFHDPDEEKQHQKRERDSLDSRKLLIFHFVLS